MGVTDVTNRKWPIGLRRKKTGFNRYDIVNSTQLGLTLVQGIVCWLSWWITKGFRGRKIVPYFGPLVQDQFADKAVVAIRSVKAIWCFRSHQVDITAEKCNEILFHICFPVFGLYQHR